MIDEAERSTPTLGVPWLNTIVFVNFFVFCFVVRYSALGILPSEDGFVLQERGIRIPTTEGLWVANLFYTYVSWLSPLAMVTYAIIWQGARPTGPRIGRWLFLSVFVVVLTLGTWSLTTKLVLSLRDWCMI